MTSQFQPAIEPNILDLYEFMRLNAQSRARQLAGWIDVYLHTLPPAQRLPALRRMLESWCEHQRLWAIRIDAAVALETERRLTSFDWSETEAALRMLARDMERSDD